MYRTKNEATARRLASDHGLHYGFSVFPPAGCWYVGRPEELAKIGVVEPRDPADDTIKAVADLLDV